MLTPRPITAVMYAELLGFANAKGRRPKTNDGTRRGMIARGLVERPHGPDDWLTPAGWYAARAWVAGREAGVKTGRAQAERDEKRLSSGEAQSLAALAAGESSDGGSLG